MKVRLKLLPGQKGTKNLLTQFGKKLVCVRYRYDEKTRKRYTTVELIVAESPWTPSPFKPDSLVLVKIPFDDVDMRKKAKEAGARWSQSKKAWKLDYKTVCALGLKSKIVGEAVKT